MPWLPVVRYRMVPGVWMQKKAATSEDVREVAGIADMSEELHNVTFPERKPSDGSRNRRLQGGT